MWCVVYTRVCICICERVTPVHHCTSLPCTSGVECWCQPAQQKMQAALPQVPVQATMVPHGWAPKVIAVSTQLFQFLSQMPLTCCSKSNINTESGLVLKSPFPLPTMGSYAIMFLKRKSLFLKTSELFSHRLNRASRRSYSQSYKKGCLLSMTQRRFNLLRKISPVISSIFIPTPLGGSDSEAILCLLPLRWNGKKTEFNFWQGIVLHL